MEETCDRFLGRPQLVVALDMLDEAGVETHVLPTEQAVERYNELQADDEPVGGLFHSTC